MITNDITTLPSGHYGQIEADPAWSWISYAGKGSAPHRTEEEPYPVMTLDEMKQLPIADIAAKDCLLNMWVIGSHLDQAIELGRHWGFTYKSDGFVWVKTGKHDPAVRPISMGKWVRKQVEYSLIFTRGKPRRLDAGVRQLIETGDNVIYAPKREHSRKPDERYERLERLCAGPRVELFAQNTREGWDSWGNRVGKYDLIPTQIKNDLSRCETFNETVGITRADEQFEILLG